MQRSNHRLLIVKTCDNCKQNNVFKRADRFCGTACKREHFKKLSKKKIMSDGTQLKEYGINYLLKKAESIS